MKLLLSIEKSLENKPVEGKEWCDQILEMLKSGVAIVLTEEDLKNWEEQGRDFHYLAPVAVKGKKSMRLCWDAARRQGGHPSMNECLYKGPDRFINNLLSVILAFRNGRVGCMADIKKFHNQIHLFPEDIHMQRFLWRGLNPNIPPQTLAIARNNFGIVSANCIATCALRRSADEFSTVYPIESEEVKHQTYIDDGLTAAPSKSEAVTKTQRWDEICAHGSMFNKGWTYSGDDKTDIVIGGDLARRHSEGFGPVMGFEN